MKPDYEKNKIALRYWLIGKGFNQAVKAMNFAEIHHNGLRRDGQPEFSHQVMQALYCRTLIDSLLYPELTFIVIFLHDTVEDIEEVTIEVINEMFGQIVAEKVNKVSKVRAGVKIPNDIYYPAMAEDPVVSVVKALDRDHNISTMLNGMTIEKQKAYIKETRDYVIVMLKRAKRAFPEQEAFYENLKYSLFKQVQLYEAIHETQAV